MRKAFGSMLIVVSVPLFSARADDLPTKFDFDRYKGMLEHSPFAIASAIAVPAATPDFAKDLYVANAARSIDGDMVTIASASDKDFKKYLTTKAPVDGYAIASIKWSRKMGRTKVTITKDGQFATLTFNQMVQVQPLTNQPPSIVQPGSPQAGFPKPFGLPTPSAHLRGVRYRNAIGQTPSPSAED
jgi:hypothetical protein